MAKRKYEKWEDIPQEILDKVGKYVTNLKGRTFVLHDLPPEFSGGVLARYSRAQTGLRMTLVNEFLGDDGEPSQEMGRALMDRVLNAFGDESVGELEGVHVGIEDISQLGTKFIEDRRIGGSPIEQSTRYVVYDKKDSEGKWRYLRPKEIQRIELSKEFESVNDRAFEVYSDGVGKLMDYFRAEFPREKHKIEVKRGGKMVSASESELINDDERRTFSLSYNFTIRCAALDVGRCVLPASTLTHLGVFGNGRYFTNLISYMKSNELEEARERGSELETELSKVIPTYIKRNRVNLHQPQINSDMRKLADELFGDVKPSGEKVTLVESRDYLTDVVAHSLFPYSRISLQQLTDELEMVADGVKEEILRKYIGARESRRDRSGRGLEAGYPIVFDLVGGFAEYRDLERHRILTQQRQDLTTELGFIMPPEMNLVGLETDVLEVVEKMEELNEEIRSRGEISASQYATLFNHRVRFYLGMNAREFQHLAELRTQPAGHFSYRSMVMEMTRQLYERDDWMKLVTGYVDFADPGNKISRAAEQSRIAGRNLATGTDAADDF